MRIVLSSKYYDNQCVLPLGVVYRANVRLSAFKAYTNFLPEQHQQQRQQRQKNLTRIAHLFAPMVLRLLWCDSIGSLTSRTKTRIAWIVIAQDLHLNLSKTQLDTLFEKTYSPVGSCININQKETWWNSDQTHENVERESEKSAINRIQHATQMCLLFGLEFVARQTGQRANGRASVYVRVRYLFYLHFVLSLSFSVAAYLCLSCRLGPNRFTQLKERWHECAFSALKEHVPSIPHAHRPAGRTFDQLSVYKTKTRNNSDNSFDTISKQRALLCYFGSFLLARLALRCEFGWKSAFIK